MRDFKFVPLSDREYRFLYLLVLGVASITVSLLFVGLANRNLAQVLIGILALAQVLLMGRSASRL